MDSTNSSRFGPRLWKGLPTKSPTSFLDQQIGMAKVKQLRRRDEHWPHASMIEEGWEVTTKLEFIAEAVG